MYNSVVFLYLIALIKNRYNVKVINMAIPVKKASTLKSSSLKSFVNKRKPASTLPEIKSAQESALL